MATDPTLQMILKTAGYSVTKGRLAVFEALRGQEPLRMHDLVARCTGVDRASVYRTVELYERLGVIQRLQQGWKYSLELTDKFTAHHHHLVCTSCGRSVDLSAGSIEAAIDRLAAAEGFTATGHQLEVQGLCGGCRPRH